MSYILSLLVLGCSITTNICLKTGIGNNENSRLSNLQRKTLKTYPGCPKGWSRFRDHCYFFSKDQKGWFEAERGCRSKGSSLAAIVDKAENDWVFANAQEQSFVIYWIGLTDVEHEKWIYSEDFSPVIDFLWYPGEPNGKTSENCMDVYTGRNGLWNDRPCKDLINYVCRKYVRCCPSEGASLVYIADKAENHLVYARVRGWRLIGQLTTKANHLWSSISILLHCFV